MYLKVANDPTLPRDGTHTWQVHNPVDTPLYYISWSPAGWQDIPNPELTFWTEQEGAFMHINATLDEALSILATLYDYGTKHIPIED